jgi:hypothetical protein
MRGVLQKAESTLRIVALVLALSLFFGGLALYVSGGVSAVAQFAAIVHGWIGIGLLAVLGVMLLLHAARSPWAAVVSLKKAIVPLLFLAALVASAEFAWTRLMGPGITMGPPFTLSLYLWTAIYLGFAVRRAIAQRDIGQIFAATPHVMLLFCFLCMVLLNGDGAFKSGTPKFREVHTLAGIFLIAQLLTTRLAESGRQIGYRQLVPMLRVLAFCAVPASLIAATPKLTGMLGAIPFEAPQRQSTAAAPALPLVQVKLESGRTFDRVEYDKLAQTCGTEKCHPTTTRDWQHSSHRRAASDKLYQAAFNLLIKERGAASAQWCHGCHSPVDLVMSDGEDKRTGVDCLTCHLVTSYTTEGNASFTLRDLSFREQEYIAEPGSDRWMYLIGALPDLHKKMFDVTPLKDSAFCESCHRQVMPEAVNGHGDLVLAQDMHDMAKSPFGARGYRCQDCHMKKVFDVGAYSMTEHLFLGGGLTEAQTENDAEMLALTRRWLSGDVTARLHAYPSINPWANPKLDGVKSHLDLDLAARWEASDLLLSYRVTNTFVGHSFPKMVDLVRVWMETEVRDSDGTLLAHSGALDDRGRIVGSPPTLGATQVNEHGVPISQHRVWEIRDVVDQRMLAPEESRSETIRLPLQNHPTGPEISVTARWNYQRTNPEAFYWAVGETYGPPASASLVEKTIRVPVPRSAD